jgi:hypothetical protein
MTIKLIIITIFLSHATANVPFETMYRIANCESSLNPLAKNKHSTAGGLFQFTDPTWKWLKCEGSKYNPIDATKCFVKHYPKYPHYWVCK